MEISSMFKKKQIGKVLTEAAQEVLPNEFSDFGT